MHREEKVNLKNLAKQMDYKWRVQSFSKNKASASCVAYVDARQVQDRLDEVCGPENWQNDYYIVGGLLFCKIGIKIGDEWVWKGDTGSESSIEKEKGHVSDAFKRAAVHWNIGRFLYEIGIKYVTANEKKTQSSYPYVVDSSDKRVWDLTEHIRNTNKFPPKSTTPPANMSSSAKPSNLDTQTAQANRLIKLMNGDEAAKDLQKRYKDNTQLIASFSENLKKQIYACYWARKEAIKRQEVTPPPVTPNPVNETLAPQNKEEMPSLGDDDLPPVFDEEPFPGEPTAREKAIRDAKAHLDSASKDQLPEFMTSLKATLDKMPLDDQGIVRSYYENLLKK